MPRTDTLHNRELAVDDLLDIEDAPLVFAYGKDLLPSWLLSDCPTYMQRMHNWYKRACRLGLKTLYAPHHPVVFGVKGHKSMISCLILKTSSTCSASHNLASKWFDYGSCKCLIDFVLLSKVLYMHKYLMPYINSTVCKQWMLLFVISRSGTLIP